MDASKPIRTLDSQRAAIVRTFRIRHRVGRAGAFMRYPAPCDGPTPEPDAGKVKDGDSGANICRLEGREANDMEGSLAIVPNSTPRVRLSNLVVQRPGRISVNSTSCARSRRATKRKTPFRRLILIQELRPWDDDPFSSIEREPEIRSRVHVIWGICRHGRDTLRRPDAKTGIYRNIRHEKGLDRNSRGRKIGFAANTMERGRVFTGGFAGPGLRRPKFRRGNCRSVSFDLVPCRLRAGNAIQTGLKNRVSVGTGHG